MNRFAPKTLSVLCLWLLASISAISQEISTHKAPAVVSAPTAALTADGARLERIVDGLAFGEGPAADSSGNLYFTDIPNNRVLKWSPDGTVTIVRENTGHANGLYFDSDGDLYACEMANRRVTQMAPDGTLTVVADKWDGKRFNQPNDLWIDAKGGIYVTDPIYMTVKDREIETEDLYYIKPESREVLRVAEGMVRPNGVIGTRDGKTLYVGDHGGNKTYIFDIQEDGTLANKRVFADSGSDGMTLDEMGNVYLTGGKEVKIFDKNGVSLPSIPVPDPTTNVTFGGKDRSILFITSPEAVYKMPMRVKGQ